MRLTLSTLALLALLVVPCAAQTLLTGLEDISKWQATGGAVVERSTDAHEGAACAKVTMPGQLSGRILDNYPPAAFDTAQGVSFWAKGDGSREWGCIALFGDGSNRSYSYCYFFPLSSTEWRKYDVPWADWIPEGAFTAIGTPGGLPPSGVQWLRLGTRWTITFNNAQIAKHTYWVDEVRLEQSAPQPAAAPAPASLASVITKLRDKKPVHILCMGDSITAGTGLPDRDAQRYATLLQAQLRQRLGYNEVYAESRAVGGAKVTDARAWVNRDFQGPAPDLVTTLYGYNDKSNLFSAQQFADSLNDYYRRICAVTGGKTAILPLTTIPGAGPRFVMMDDFAQVVRDVAGSWHISYLDLGAAMKKIGREELLPYMGDMAHPNPSGHELMATVIADYLVQQVEAAK
ncbi:GDSL-type esterase/lipase family protein [bacterium]|nr:GDSL-type esterase/lipase family protein [bacterium]